MAKQPSGQQAAFTPQSSPVSVPLPNVPNTESNVRCIAIEAVGYASIVQLGDCDTVLPSSSALAIQRQRAVFFGHEGSFDQFPIFNRPIPRLRSVTEEELRFSDSRQGSIVVDIVDILSLSSAAVLQVGSNRRIEAANRVKHIRQLQKRPSEAELTAGADSGFELPLFRKEDT